MSNQLPIQNDPPLQALVGQLRELIRDARGRALRSVDAIQVRTCWEMGRHIVEFEQGGAIHYEMIDRPTFVECVIVGNSAGKSGGGIAL